MSGQQLRRAKGISIIEIMVTIVILAIMVIGTSNYRYYAAMDARKAAMHSTAARVAVLLCESWRGLKGAETFDPIAYFGSELPLANGTGPVEPEDFTLLGNYTVELNEVDYYVTLSWKDVSTGLRALNVVVVWAQRNQGEDMDSVDKTFALTTYSET